MGNVGSRGSVVVTDVSASAKECSLSVPDVPIQFRPGVDLAWSQSLFVRFLDMTKCITVHHRLPGHPDFAQPPFS